MAARRASGHLLLFLDPEMKPSQEPLMRLVSTGLRKPHPWAVGVHPESLNMFYRQRRVTRTLPEVFLYGRWDPCACLVSDLLVDPYDRLLGTEGL